MTFTISKESLPFRADKSISQITLSNERLTIVVHAYGARVHQLLTPDKNGTFENILLSKNDSETYTNDGGYYGVICGPVAGRISGATYDSVSLEANEGKNNLHSGSHGWERQFWSYETFETASSLGIKLSLRDEESGFPGQIQAEVTYKLTDNKLEVTISGLSVTDTVFNPAWHPYFNLSAELSTTHEHFIQANVDDSSYSIKESVSIKKLLKDNPEGLDDCFVFNPKGDKSLMLYDPLSGWKLVAQTDRQAVVIYTATNPEIESMINGRPMSKNRGIAIEFQEIPDLVHHPEWGTIELKAGQKKTFITEYLFTTN
ncbi:aldose epimerase family protein [Lactococcus lactis]|uniref:aldose epimerase family protein n=1 Tax=Lactococcus lactis TaxID=1358 RepID=UPI00223ADD07|nr:aldose epimerase family protein [Lactococcus lactis]MCT0027117.1 galactose mutarotase [Lactococcus lactis subsp. lactis]MCT3105800.1 galactose mutarotase [Lactococcus lactis]